MPKENDQLKEKHGNLVEENKNLRVKVADLQEQINKMRKKKGRKALLTENRSRVRT